MPSCYCGRGFRDFVSLDQHRQAKKHGYCLHCTQSFASAEAYEQHRIALHSFCCGICQRNFALPTALRQHQEDTGHTYHCRDCNRNFGSAEALNQHLNSSIHTSHFHCCDCDRDFVNADALNQHLANKVHKPKEDTRLATAQNLSWSCQECGRDFANEMSLNQHLSSVKHHPLSNITCPGDKRCKKRFTSPSALVHHLESGACRSGITRKSLNALIQSKDVDQLIHDGSKEKVPPSLDWDDGISVSSFGGVPIMTPKTERSNASTPLLTPLLSGLLTPTTSGSDIFGSSLALNSSSTCPLCAKKFRSRGALQDHMSSPAHESKIFHCPLSFTGLTLDDSATSKVPKLFSTLSGLTQHLESGACAGGSGLWRVVMAYVEDQARQNGWKNLRLLN